jgi:head-tail adaptor
MLMAKYTVRVGELRTKIKFYIKISAYIPGQGQTSTWEPTETRHCRWVGSYGDQVMAAQALGVEYSATVTMRYSPDLYESLRTTQTVVVKNADSTAIVDGEPDMNNPNVYQLWGGVDNVREKNQYMEFMVRRYEGL